MAKKQIGRNDIDGSTGGGFTATRRLDVTRSRTLQSRFRSTGGEPDAAYYWARRNWAGPVLVGIGVEKKDQRGSDSPRSSVTGSMRYAGMGIELAASIVGLTLVGYWVDHHFGTDRVGLTVGAVLGIVGGMYNFIRQALDMSSATGNRPNDTDNDEKGSRR